MEDDNKPPEDKPAEKAEEAVENPLIETRSQYQIVGISLELYCDTGRVIPLNVNSKDINKVLADTPQVAEIFSQVICYIFFDVAKIWIYNSKGEQVELQDKFNICNDGKRFLPNKGKLYSLNDPGNDADPKSLMLKAIMAATKKKSCFVSNSHKIIFFDAEKGDRILEESEITAVKLNEGVIPATEEAETAAAEEPKKEAAAKDEPEEAPEAPADGDGDGKKPTIN